MIGAIIGAFLGTRSIQKDREIEKYNIIQAKKKMLNDLYENDEISYEYYRRKWAVLEFEEKQLDV